MTTQENIIHYRERGYSKREIAVLMQTSLAKVEAAINPVVAALRKKRKRAKQNEQKRIPGKARTGKIGRCGGCGGKVVLPCQLCKVRGLAATV